MYLSKKWLVVILIALIAGVAGIVYWDQLTTAVQAQTEEITGQQATGATDEEGAQPPTTAVLPASLVLGSVSASGNIELVEEVSVASGTAGTVTSILAAVGDTVQAGQLLATLDTIALERAVHNAELSVTSAQLTLEEAMEEADAADIAVAEANLADAQENLAEVMAGPSEQELAAARSKVSSSWSAVSELQADPSDAELTQLSADLRKAEVTLEEAQRAYDKIAWQGNAGASSEAADLQTATIDYESALAAYEETMAPVDTSTLQSAVSTAQSAEVDLEELENSPTPAEIATAEAAVVDAEAALAELLEGPAATEIESARVTLEQALLQLEEAYADLAAAQITAPMDGTILTINVARGDQISSGAEVATVADATDLQLTISVAEVDIPQVEIGQAATIEFTALTGQTYDGVVTTIAPAADSSSTSVSYAVTIRLVGDALSEVLPGMTAVATLENSTLADENSLMVPTSAIRSINDESVVMVVGDEETMTPVSVTPGAVQGEWTVVTSTDLSEGDRVLGSVSSPLSEESETPFGGGPPGGGIGAGGGGTRPTGAGGRP